MRCLVVACLLAGCVEHRVSTWPSELATAATDLRVRGEATIEVTEGDDRNYDRKRRTAKVRASDEVGVEIDLGQGASRRLDMRIDQLLAGCPADPSQHAGCPLSRVRGPLVLERDRRADKLVGLSIAGGLVFSGAIACSFACDAPWSTVSRVTAGAITIASLASLAIVYVIKQGPR